VTIVAIWSEPSIPHLLFQEPVLFDQVLDHPLLMAVHPAGEDQ
jgi:hypothetical protein